MYNIRKVFKERSINKESMKWFEILAWGLAITSAILLILRILGVIG
jgi:hypothetical protein